MAYHALWFVDYDLSPADQEFKSPAFDIYDYELAVKEPPFEHPYSKDDLEKYVEHCRARSWAAIQLLDRSDANVLRGCERTGGNVTEQIIGSIRHVQHHAAQLNLLLRQTIDSAPGWVRRSTKKSNDDYRLS